MHYLVSFSFHSSESENCKLWDCIVDLPKESTIPSEGYMGKPEIWKDSKDKIEVLEEPPGFKGNMYFVSEARESDADDVVKLATQNKTKLLFINVKPQAPVSLPTVILSKDRCNILNSALGNVKVTIQNAVPSNKLDPYLSPSNKIFHGTHTDQSQEENLSGSEAETDKVRVSENSLLGFMFNVAKGTTKVISNTVKGTIQGASEFVRGKESFYKTSLKALLTPGSNWIDERDPSESFWQALNILIALREEENKKKSIFIMILHKLHQLFLYLNIFQYPTKNHGIIVF